MTAEVKACRNLLALAELDCVSDKSLKEFLGRNQLATLATPATIQIVLATLTTTVIL